MTPARKVLFIIIDQLRADVLSGALAEQAQLPNLTAFGDDAVVFERHYSVTNPCGPSRASIFTGRYAMNHRSVRNGTPLADHIPNLAREVRKAGMEPWLYGYTDTSLDPNAHAPADPALRTEEQVLPGMREMVEMRLMESYPWRAHLKARGYDLPAYSHFYDQRSPDPGRPPRPDDPPFYRAEDSDTAFLTDRFLSDMAVREAQDWFAVLTWIRPHPPLVAPEPYNRMYDPARLPLPARLPDRAAEAAVHPFMAGALMAPRMQDVVRGCKVDPDSDDDLQALRAVYLGLAREVDDHFGRIIGWLRDSGQYDDTLIVVCADHGEMLGEHHMWGKQVPYEGAWHVPLMIRAPGGVRGRRVSALTESTDLMPTILDLIGASPPPGVDGRSLRPFLQGEAPADWRDCVHLELEYGEPHHLSTRQAATGTPLDRSNLAILREERWKLVHFNGDLPPLLFDMENDPGELTNLADDPAHAATLLRLTRKLLDLRMTHEERSLTRYFNGPEGSLSYHEPL